MSTHVNESMAWARPVACMSCRRLKMRCIGLEAGQGCFRCQKASRECVVQPSRRGRQRISTPAQDANSDQPNSKHSRLRGHQASTDNHESLTPSDMTNGSAEHAPTSALARPCYRSGMPYNDVSDEYFVMLGRNVRVPFLHLPNLVMAVHSQVSRPPRLDHISKRKECSHQTQLELPEEQSLIDLVAIFRNKFLYYLPIIDEKDIADITSLVRKRPHLAYCVCYVTSNYVPGAHSIRQLLVRYVTKFLAGLNGPLETDEDTIWSQLQAYAILYAYRSTAEIADPPYISPSEPHLDQWTIKSGIESFSLRHNLHNGYEEVRDLIHSGNGEVSSSVAFRKYTFWLYLFALSHTAAVMTGTPPTIRPDSTITAACTVLRHVVKPARISRILAEVDLCMLWNAADSELPGLGEWWCPPALNIDPSRAIAVLEDADAALHVWSRRWGVNRELDATYPGLDISKNQAVGFHFRSTRFLMHLTTARIVHRICANTIPSQRSFDENAADRMVNELLLKSASAAMGCCNALRELGPSKKENARYMADLGFLFIAFCCNFIVEVWQAFPLPPSDLEEYLHKVEETAKVMSEMAVGSNQSPKEYGQQVLQSLDKARERNSTREKDAMTGS